MLDIDAHYRGLVERSGALSRMRLAGWLMLSPAILMLGFALLDQTFHFTTPNPHADNQGDIGILLVVWFGIGLIRKRTGYILPAKVMCGLYFCMFTALTVTRIFVSMPGSTLNLFVPITSPTLWHYSLLEIFATAFFGAPLFLLSTKPVRAVLWYPACLHGDN